MAWLFISVELQLLPHLLCKCQKWVEHQELKSGLQGSYTWFKAVIFQLEVLAAQRASISTWRYFHLRILLAFITWVWVILNVLKSGKCLHKEELSHLWVISTLQSDWACIISRTISWLPGKYGCSRLAWRPFNNPTRTFTLKSETGFTLAAFSGKILTVV